MSVIHTLTVFLLGVCVGAIAGGIVERAVRRRRYEAYTAKTAARLCPHGRDWDECPVCCH